jgi:hypothetical protein
MRAIVPAIGGLSHEEFRRFCNERRSSPQRNLVDGDLIEHFLDLSPSDAELVVKQLSEDLTAWLNNKPVAGNKRALSATAATGASSSTSAGVNATTSTSIFNMAQPVSISVEECMRRVEDMARLH